MFDWLFDGSYDVTARGGYRDNSIHNANTDDIYAAIDEYRETVYNYFHDNE